MATVPSTGEQTLRRTIPAGMVDDAHKHVYEAAVRTPLVRLNYDGQAENVRVAELIQECLKSLGEDGGTWN